MNSGIRNLLFLLGFVALCTVGFLLWKRSQGTPAIVKQVAPSVSSTPADMAEWAKDSTFGRPYDPQNRAVVVHTGYVLGYDESAEQAAWVAYWLDPMRTRHKVDRTDNFEADPAVPTGSSTPEVYRGSGYDRGHLAPAADMSWSSRTMRESFYMSNMSPQEPEFNRGIWERTESLVRRWASAYRKLYVVSGPILVKGEVTKSIGKGAVHVKVPKRYYKIVFESYPPELKAIAFVMENRALSGSPRRYAVSIDSVEALTGLDFFPQLPDSLEAPLECCPNPNAWD